jgi:hypothetical protein
MKKYGLILVAGFLLFLAGCQVVGGIFKAGVWAGIILVVAVIVLIIYLISRMGRRP